MGDVAAHGGAVADLGVGNVPERLRKDRQGRGNGDIALEIAGAHEGVDLHCVVGDPHPVKVGQSVDIDPFERSYQCIAASITPSDSRQNIFSFSFKEEK